MKLQYTEQLNVAHVAVRILTLLGLCLGSRLQTRCHQVDSYLEIQRDKHQSLSLFVCWAKLISLLLYVDDHEDLC